MHGVAIIIIGFKEELEVPYLNFVSFSLPLAVDEV